MLHKPEAVLVPQRSPKSVSSPERYRMDARLESNGKAEVTHDVTAATMRSRSLPSNVD